MSGRVDQGHAVGAVEPWDLPEQLAGLGIHHHHPGLAGDEQPVIRRVHRDEIPPAVPAELEIPGDVIRPLGARLGEEGG